MVIDLSSIQELSLAMKNLYVYLGHVQKSNSKRSIVWSCFFQECIKKEDTVDGTPTLPESKLVVSKQAICFNHSRHLITHPDSEKPQYVWRHCNRPVHWGGERIATLQQTIWNVLILIRLKSKVFSLERLQTNKIEVLDGGWVRTF